MRRFTSDPKNIFIFIFLIGGFLRFYKLDWGDGYLFHPDEYHIVNSVNQLDFPTQMNPHFFSYGSFTTYLIYFSKQLFKLLGAEVKYVHIFLIGRFYSASFSTLTIAVVFLLSQKIFKNHSTPLISAALVAFTPGLIQQAHFATPESSLTFWIFLTMLLWLYWFLFRKNIYLLLSGVSLGIALAVKVVALAFLPVYGLLFFSGFELTFRHLIKKIKIFLLTIILIVATYLAVFPYSLLDWKGFKHSVTYEGSIARGTQEVFYTRQFYDTKPLVFQFQKILPYTLGPAVLVTSVAGFFYILLWPFIDEVRQRTNKLNKILRPERNTFLRLWKKIKTENGSYLLFLTIPFLLFFIPNVYLFTKWTRFIAPTFIFFILFTAVFIESLKNRKSLSLVATFVTLSTTVLWSLMFFSIYNREDVRVTATKWIQTNIDPQVLILTEAQNMLEVPLEGNYYKQPFDFYKLDQNPFMLSHLAKSLSETDYFIIQSRRSYKNHLKHSGLYPLAANFYAKLFEGSLGFRQVEEFTSYPGVSLGTWNLVVPDENAEETWSVFDHPRILVFKKDRYLGEDEMFDILETNRNKEVYSYALF